MPQANAERGRSFRLAPQLLNIVALAGSAFAVVAIGSLVAALLPDASAVEVAAAYLAPAGLVFAAYWWMDQKI